MTERPTPRAHPAQGSRIAAVGVGMASMLGIVGAMGLAHRGQSSTPPAPAPAPVAVPAQVLVVVHQDAASPSGVSVTVPSTSTGTGQAPALPNAAAPVVLTARPVVTAAPVQATRPTPTAKTHGSR